MRGSLTLTTRREKSAKTEFRPSGKDNNIGKEPMDCETFTVHRLFYRMASGQYFLEIR